MLGYFFAYFFRLFSQKSSKIPVICIGGILAGGVGKTPIVKEIAKKLPNSAVVMRGYGAKSVENVKVKKSDTATQVGDEARMLNNAGLPVFIGKNRLFSIQKAEKDGAAQVIMDDGFQNPSVKKDVSVLVFDENIGVGNGFMLPAGPLREPLHYGIRRADALIIIGNKGAESKIIKIAKKYKKPVFYAKSQAIDIGLVGNVVAFAGIGYPQKFFNSVAGFDQRNVTRLTTVPFPDHHNFSGDELRRLENVVGKRKAMLITTEKDWVRLSKDWQKKVRYVPLETTIEPEFWKWLKEKL